MSFDHAAAEAQISANVTELGDSWQIGSGVPFAGVIASTPRADGLGGTAFDLEITVNRALLGSTLPAEGVTVTNTRTGEAFRLSDHRRGDTAAQIVLVVTAALR